VTPAQRAIAITIVVAFLAGLAGIGLGRVVFAPERAPSLHQVLHDELDLSPAQEQEIEALERDFATRRRALEVEMRAANAELAAGMREEHEYGPRVTAAVERFHHAMGELQSETMRHVFAMRAVLTPEQCVEFDALVASALTDGRQ
jgi:Spy/CpxP family protein refolding chaperone